MGQLWLSQKPLLKAFESSPRHYRLLEKCNLVRTHMNQFLQNLASYTFNEVVESRFCDFFSKLPSLTSYDDLKNEIVGLIDSLLVKSFLERDQDGLYKYISDLLECASRFCSGFKSIEKHSYVLDKNGCIQINENLPLERCIRMIDSQWKVYENVYLSFLATFECSLSSEIRSLLFKFDFNSYHGK